LITGGPFDNLQNIETISESVKGVIEVIEKIESMKGKLLAEIPAKDALRRARAAIS
jgi:hypothetical protein